MSNATEELIAEGEFKNLLKNIRSLMDSLHWTAEKAMDLLDVPPEMQKELAPLINEKILEVKP